MDWIVEANSGITVIRWLDSGSVQLVSNYVGKENLVHKQEDGQRKKKSTFRSTGPLQSMSIIFIWEGLTFVTCFFPSTAYLNVL
jgi:hypothetical protein